MNDLLRLALEKAVKYWHRPASSLLAVLATAGLVLFTVSGGTEHKVTPLGWALTAGASAIVGLVWAFTNRLPRNPKGKVGVAVAIVCDDEAHHQRVQADFVDNLRSLVMRDSEASNLALLVLPSWAAERVNQAGVAGSYLRKIRGHFMLFGRIRKRLIQGRESHVLEFEGVVVHAPTSAEVQQDLEHDFNLILPRKVLFPEDNDVFAFQATSQWADVAARYVIGMAALISGSVAYAEKLFLDVERRLSRVPPGQPLRQLASRLPVRFRVLYDSWLRALIDRYTTTRELRFASKAEDIASKLLARDQYHYRALLMKAMCEFLLRRNVREAKRLLQRCRGSRDVTWLYSRAFLSAWEGRLGDARRDYERAFVGRLDDATVPIQVEEFIQLTLEEEPDRIQLHYCSGIVNFFAKRDYAAAKQDFERFVRSVTGGQFADAAAEAEDLVRRCDEHLRVEAA